MIMKQAKSISDKKHIDDLNLFQKQMDIFRQGISNIFSVPPPSVDMITRTENSKKHNFATKQQLYVGRIQ